MLLSMGHSNFQRSAVVQRNFVITFFVYLYKVETLQNKNEKIAHTQLTRSKSGIVYD